MKETIATLQRLAEELGEELVGFPVPKLIPETIDEELADISDAGVCLEGN